jgi:hypothetical protein
MVRTPHQSTSLAIDDTYRPDGPPFWFDSHVGPNTFQYVLVREDGRTARRWVQSGNGIKPGNRRT